MTLYVGQVRKIHDDPSLQVILMSDYIGRKIIIMNLDPTGPDVIPGDVLYCYENGDLDLWDAKYILMYSDPI